MSLTLPCGHTAEDDGDRYYTDHCWAKGCGWMTPWRSARLGEQALANQRLTFQQLVARTPWWRPLRRRRLQLQLAVCEDALQVARAVTFRISKARSIEVREQRRQQEEARHG
jgi:hypothetical protein